MKHRMFVRAAVALAVAVGLLLPVQAQAQQLIALVTGGTAGVYFPLGGAMAEIWNSKVPNVRVSSQSSGASVANVQFLARNEAHLALIQNDIAFYAFNGKEMFFNVAQNRGAPVPTIRAVAMLYPETIQIVTLRGKGINRVEDLAGKRVVVGAPGSGTEANARQILLIHGIFYSQIRPDYLSFAAGIDQLRDGSVDAVFITAGYPTAAVTDIAASRDVMLVPISSEKLAELRERYPFYARQVVAAGAYRGLTAPVQTATVLAMLVARADLSNDLVYNMTKALWESLDRIRAAHAVGRSFDLAKAREGMPIPIHPGAERYYREKGVR
jgi:TRAP transporter TAXI family solute receptor